MTEAVFVGRSEEVSRGQKAVDEASSGKGRLLLFSGEAGIGKTRMADEIASFAANRDARIVWGRCWEAGGAPAYWPWIQILRALGIEDDVFSGDDREVRFRQFDRAATQLKRIASDQLLVVVLDDLHTADVPSLLFLHFLARDLRATRILVLGTYRDAEARLAPDVFALLAKVAREGDSVPLPRLSRDDVLAWIRARMPDADDATAERVHRTTEGNALFVQELLRMRETPAEGELPDGLRAVLDEHLARVPDDVREILAVGSVLGRDLDAAIVAALTSRSVTEVDTHLGTAHEAGVLTSHRGGRRLSFAHIRVRERLYTSLPSLRRASLHVAVAEHLLAHGGDPATVAFHFVEGREAASPERAARALLAAARSAQSRVAFEDAARLARSGLGLVDEPPGDDAAKLACDLELALGEALMSIGDTTTGQEACVRAAERAKRINEPERLANAALFYAMDIATGRIDERMMALLDDALRAVPDTATKLRAKILARWASSLTPPRSEEDVPRILGAANEAMAMADRLGDDDTTLYVYKFASSAAGYLVSSDERASHTAKILPIIERRGRSMELLNLGSWFIAVARERGDLATAHDVLERMKRAAREYPQPHWQWRLRMLDAQRALFAGDLDEADRLGREARAMDSSPMLRFHYAMFRLSMTLVRDEPLEVRMQWGEDVAPLASILGINPVAGIGAAILGRNDAAREHVRTVLRYPASFPSMIMAAETCSMLGDAELARAILPSVRPFLGKQIGFWSSHGSLFVGPVERCVARLAALSGEIEEAQTLYEAAIRTCERMDARPYGERARRELAALGATKTSSASNASSRPSAIAMEREGEVWRITAEGRTIRVKDTKGLAYLADLVARPGQDLHVTQLAELADSVTGDAGPILDAKAKAAYKARVESLRSEIDEATRFGDFSRAERAEEEIEAIAEQIASAVGLGGRDRKAGSHIERARINVQRRLKDAIQRIGEHDPTLGKYLSASVKTGTYCSFTPF